MSAGHILLVEDELGLIVTISDRLAGEGFTVDVAEDGHQGLQAGSTKPYDLVLLDIMLPGPSGFDICQELRRRDISTPILMLTARDQVVDKVVGLKLGADDYLTKPFDMAELLARIEALLRRSGKNSEVSTDLYRFGEVRIELRRARVERGGKVIELSAKEFALLRYFLKHPDDVLSRNELLDQVWGYQAEVSTRTVDVHIAALRKKLEIEPHRPRHFQTVHGLGYRFVPG